MAGTQTTNVGGTQFNPSVIGAAAVPGINPQLSAGIYTMVCEIMGNVFTQLANVVHQAATNPTLLTNFGGVGGVGTNGATTGTDAPWKKFVLGLIAHTPMTANDILARIQASEYAGATSENNLRQWLSRNVGSKLTKTADGYKAAGSSKH